MRGRESVESPWIPAFAGMTIKGKGKGKGKIKMGSSFRWNDGGVWGRVTECPCVTGLDPGLRRDDGVLLLLLLLCCCVAVAVGVEQPFRSLAPEGAAQDVRR